MDLLGPQLLDAARQVKEEGQTNPLLHLVAADPAFHLDAESLAALLKPERFVGRAPAHTKSPSGVEESLSLRGPEGAEAVP